MTSLKQLLCSLVKKKKLKKEKNCWNCGRELWRLITCFFDTIDEKFTMISKDHTFHYSWAEIMNFLNDWYTSASKRCCYYYYYYYYFVFHILFCFSNHCLAVLVKWPAFLFTYFYYIRNFICDWVTISQCKQWSSTKISPILFLAFHFVMSKLRNFNLHLCCWQQSCFVHQFHLQKLLYCIAQTTSNLFNSFFYNYFFTNYFFTNYFFIVRN